MAESSNLCLLKGLSRQRDKDTGVGAEGLWSAFLGTEAECEFLPAFRHTPRSAGGTTS